MQPRQNIRYQQIQRSPVKLRQLQPNLQKIHSSVDIRNDLELANKKIKYNPTLQSVQSYAPPQHTQQQQYMLPGIGMQELPLGEMQSLLSAYMDMLNQENDLFYLFDSFHQILNSLKQVQNELGIKLDSNPFKTNNGSSSRNDWLTISSMGTQWSGLKNLKSLSNNNESNWIYQNQSKLSKGLDKSKILEQRSSRIISDQETIQSNASRIIDKLKREIGELTDEQKHNQSIRSVQGMNGVQVLIFNHEKLKELLFPSNGKKLVSIYQLQNKVYKSHLGFCQISISGGIVPEDGSPSVSDLVIHKLFIAKYHRKNQNYPQLIIQVMHYLFATYQAGKIKIKVNSSQTQLLKLYQELGFKLKAKQAIIGDLVIITLILLKKEINSNYKPTIKKTYQ